MKRLERLGWVSVVALGCNVAAWTSIEGCGPGDDKSDAGDGSSDQTTPDVKPDVSPDVADVNVGDVNDAGDADAPDVTEVVKFQQDYAAALCKRLSTCCYGPVDASAPDAAVAACEANAMSANVGGIEFAIGELDRAATLNSGHITVNQTAATSCLAALSTLTCGQITGTEYSSMVKNCLGALSGTLNPGQGPCRGSVECNNGYCEPPDAGFGPDASGTCVALSAVGQPCSPVGGGNDQCMYRGWLGSQQARCDIIETDDSGTCNTGPGTPTYKCTAKTAQGGDCTFEWECASNTCGDTCSCIAAGSTWTYPFFGVCPSYFGADAGTIP